MMRALTLLVAMWWALPAAAAEARLVVDFEAASGSPRWYAAALEQLVTKEASRFSRVAIADKLDLKACPGRETDCVVQRYAAAGDDIVVLGTLDGDSLAWAVHETWSFARVRSGQLSVGGANATTRRVEHGIAELVRPIVSSGGLLDKKPVAAAAKSAAAPALTFSETGHRTIALLAFVLALLVLWPPLLLLLLVGGKTLRARAPWRAWRYSAAVLAGLGTLAGVGLGPFAALPPLVLPIAGGVLWGALGIIHLGFVLPPLQGLSRIRHEALGPTLRAWLSLAALRVASLLLWFPAFTFTLLAARTAELPSRVTTGVLLPAVGLFGCFWVASLTEHLAVWLDEKLVDGPATARNAWHATVRKYFMGYVKRGGLVLDRGFLDRVLFLPGSVSSGFEVVCYGGGFGPPRIVIGTKAREAALGELPDEPEAPERQVNVEELPLGFVLPSDDDESATELARGERWRRRSSRAAPRPRAPGMPRLLGEPTTALGWVVPQPVDVAVPLISNTREDYEVVKSLLTEHYGRFEKNLDEEDHDDTDPTQKDFLFGPLMVAAGAFTRKDHLATTLALSLAIARPWASLPSRLLLRGLVALHARLLAWPRAAVADAFAALNLALHPLLQYLHLTRGGSPEALTARADTPRLIELSKTLLEDLTAKEPAGPDAQLLRASARNRMLWLAPFFAARLARPWPRWLKGLSYAAAGLLALALVADQVRDAVTYRPTYVERMTQMRTMADKAAQGATPK